MGEEVCSAFKDLFQKREKDGDVTIVCSGELIKAHGFVLSMGSSYFREVIESAPSKHPKILLKGTSATTMSNLLRCLYLGEVIIHSAFVKDFKSAADELGMFTKDAKSKLKGIPEESQVLKIPQPAFNLKNIQPVHAPADSLPTVKIRDKLRFREQIVFLNRNPREESSCFRHETQPDSV